MTHLKRLIAFVLMLELLGAGAIALAMQHSAEDLARSLLLLPGRSAWLLTSTVPDDYRLCAEMDAIGRLRGCITAKELRAKGAAERKDR